MSMALDGMAPVAEPGGAAQVSVRAPDPLVTDAQWLPRRFLIVSDAWAPQVNGVVRTYEHIGAALEARGCSVKVIGPAEFRNVALPSYPEIPLAVRPFRALAERIESYAPEAIHIPVEGPLGWAARRWCLEKGVGFSTAFHTNFPAYVAVRMPGALRRGAAGLSVAMLRRFHAPARHIYVAAPSIEAQLRQWGFANRIVRLSRGVDFDQFNPGSQPRTPGAGPVMLFVGRVAPEKNIEAFLRLDLPGRKVVVGDGPQLAVLRARYPQVEFRGTLTGKPLADAYRAADVFVFPSRTDTFGNVLLEALACGLPVAAHDAPGPRDIVAGEPLFGAIDDDLGRAVARALAAPGTRADRYAATRARYSWDEVARDFQAHAAGLRT
ncbi:glycosyltransferase involved in cell wall biosynthesis [Rhodovulum bhavnagarense]|uniref:Glycosyltransferase involved in cell wall biosynthesis n=1 Tax=Rhodovulum bhavnagarense TaxID=992286 RepID=A0A4R2RC00_9RHOB|nr:glycosyltransferase family 1 protein [Rhodovulum bhavnagarense]TCP60882.1 glycosyltransferase involved in cell wall biosynthesis [Rhodovulum bhavnagarense]